MFHQSTIPQSELWRHVVAQLPARDGETEWYVPDEIAPLLGIKPRAVRVHCLDLWPNHEPKTEWRLSYEEAVRLIRRVCWAGKKVRRPSRGARERRGGGGQSTAEARRG